MPPPNALQQYIEDELLRAPLVIEQTVQAVHDQLQKHSPAATPSERAMSADLAQALGKRRSHLIDEYLRELRRQVQSGSTIAHPSSQRHEPTSSLELSLVDEAEVTADVEMSHAIEAIKSVAEYELRELQTFTSALVGDMDVAGDHNPFRPEAHVRAMWAAAQVLTPSRGFQVHFMRQAGTPLAQVLRKAYAASSSRLESAGVEPAAYRTLILPAGVRTDRSHETHFTPDLHQIRDAMPVVAVPRSQAPAGQADLDSALLRAQDELRRMPAEAGRAEFVRLREAQRNQLMQSAGNPVDQQLIELLSRLFDAIVADRKLPQDVQLLLSRLQASALRLVLRDASALDDHAHPLWLLLDQLAFLAETLPPAGNAERNRMLRHAQGIVEHLIGEPRQDADLYHWALGRLKAYENNRLERRCAESAGQIAALQQLEDRLLATLSPPSTFAGALDIAQLDTVPADLYDAAAPTVKGNESDNSQWLARRQPGDWLRMFLQGSWVHVQLLWPGEHGEVWLVADGASTRTWAVRRGALMALRDARLLDMLAPRSLVRAAAKQVLKRLRPAEAGR